MRACGALGSAADARLFLLVRLTHQPRPPLPTKIGLYTAQNFQHTRERGGRGDGGRGASQQAAPRTGTSAQWATVPRRTPAPLQDRAARAALEGL